MDNTKRFISAIKKEKFLYESSSKDFNNAGKRKETWTRIGNKLKLSYNIVLEKWKKLIELYVRQKKHEFLCFKIGERPDCAKFWKYHMEMAFLDVYIINKYTRELKTDEIERLLNIDIKSQTDLKLDFSDEDEFPAIVENACSTENLNSTASSLEQFSNFLEKSAASIKYTCDTYAATQGVPRDSTSLLFESLALNIKSANLNADQLIEFQADICDFVYGKLSELHNQNHSNNNNEI